MKKIILKYGISATIVILSTLNAYAVAPGLYLGGMTGAATNNGGEQVVQEGNSTSTITVSPKRTQFGVRGFIGYQFNQYASVESGVSYFSAIQYNNDDAACSSTTAQLSDLDILGKGSFPLANFSVYGKAGLAVTYQVTSASLNANCSASSRDIRYRPTASIGASYDLSQNWVTDISWNVIGAGGAFQNINFYAIGISYHFVDKFCGQFLCDD